jgi:hypothetical protein
MSFMKNPAQPATTKTTESESKPTPPPPVAETKPSPIVKTKPTVIVQPSEIVKVEQTSTFRNPTHDTEWINLSDRFLLPNRTFDVQYAHMYVERLGLMRKIVTKAAENHWDSKIPIKRMNDLVCDEECILIGILFKQMVLKPSVVKQIATKVNR